jgi:hypothetical protein
MSSILRRLPRPRPSLTRSSASLTQSLLRAVLENRLPSRMDQETHRMVDSSRLVLRLSCCFFGPLRDRRKHASH